MNVIASSTWAYPVIEVFHITGVALLFGSLVVFELRVFGLGAAVAAPALARLALPVTVAGFVVAAASGLLLFAAAPDEMLGSTVFVAKMCLVLIAGLNAIGFHARGGLAATDRVARLQTAFSLLLWLAVIACGRFIAYR